MVAANKRLLVHVNCGHTIPKLMASLATRLDISGSAERALSQASAVQHKRQGIRIRGSRHSRQGLDNRNGKYSRKFSIPDTTQMGMLKGNCITYLSLYEMSGIFDEVPLPWK
ncbi:hypothetical protein T09_15057 [Trichinella sp. T9]|nr:hypothetical protein T09_15057 [Trichinella sp. T9]